MDPEERPKWWLDDNGWRGAVAFNISFFFLQLIFWSVVLCALIAAAR